MLPKGHYNSLKKVGRQSSNNDSLVTGDQQPLYNSRAAVARQQQRSKTSEKVYEPMGYPPMGCHPMGYPPMGCHPMGYPPMGCHPMGYTPMGCHPMGYPPMGCHPMMHPMGCHPMGYPPMGCHPMGYPPMGYPMMPPMGYPMYPMMPLDDPSTLVESLDRPSSFNRSSKFSDSKTPPSEDSEQRERELNEWLEKRKETGNATPVSTTQSGSQSSYSFENDPRYVDIAHPSISRTWVDPTQATEWMAEDVEDETYTKTPSDRNDWDLILRGPEQFGQLFEL